MMVGEITSSYGYVYTTEGWASMCRRARCKSVVKIVCFSKFKKEMYETGKTDNFDILKVTSFEKEVISCRCKCTSAVMNITGVFTVWTMSDYCLASNFPARASKITQSCLQP